MPERRVTYQVLAQGQLSGLSVTAPSWQRLFVDAGLALNDYRVSLDLVKDVQKETLTVAGKDLQELMVNWLNAAARLFTEKKFLAYRIVFTRFDPQKIEATLTGETYFSPRHGYPRPFEGVASTGFQMGEAVAAEGPGFNVKFFLMS